jgi:hypothetical protein
MPSKKVQTATFSYGGTKMNFTKSETQAAVRYTPGMKPAVRPEHIGHSGQLRDFEIVHVENGLDSELDALRVKPEVSVGTHIWHMDGQEDTPFIPTGYLYIEFKPGTDDLLEESLFRDFHLNIREKVGPDQYRVCTTPKSPNPIKCAVLLQEKACILVAEPEFMTRPVTSYFQFPAGQFIDTQWHLENTGNQIPVIDYPNSVYGTTHFRRGADAKVKEAWSTLQSLGDSNIKIAVIDTGFDVDHPQLSGDGSKIVNMFNAANRNADVSPWFQASDGTWGVYSHGTSCAAVAAGALDEQGVVGAAPNARLIPIKLDILSDDAIVKAFEHALLNGADIISCSLGFPKPVPLSTWVTNYIAKVAAQGRNGLGLPIFIAAGNANPASNNQPRLVSDFAAHPNVICITASNSLDEHSAYSFYGPNAFLCAPTNGNQGVGITTATVEVGPDGSSLSHTYTSGFGGTSSAAPLSAGICALILTANRNLTLDQIRYILGSTVDKIGPSGTYDGNGHSNYYGYGRIHAARAVEMAIQMLSGSQNTADQAATTAPDAPADNPADNASATQPDQSGTPLQGVVVSRLLNIRNAPSTAGYKVGQLNQGDIINLLENLPGWWRIGDNRYVCGDYVQVMTEAPSGETSLRTGQVVSATLNVRSGPSTANSIASVLQKGDTVTIYETSADGWHRIGDNQWVLGKFVQEI